MNPLMEANVRFGLVEPQAALRTLADCANHKMDYYWAVTPPSMTTKAVALFDLLIKETKARLMQLPGYLLPLCPQVRLDRAASLVALPTRLGGLT